ncbi:MAG: tetrahydromethanopterin S-methyltransferase subunit H [Candidatus Verstraetearchaeota archaeon]|nr:tetrahydromethanopterin S-methyltransferase subunit H [Candidatus Verstraetearchaeota archaeon]
MFRFEREQMVFEISGVRVGGQPGENPTVVIGSIFYRGDKTSDESGKVDKEAAQALIAKYEEVCDKVGLPCMLDVVCTRAENARKRLEFAADATKMPILIDYINDEAAVSALEAARELGIIDRVLLNSFNPETKGHVYQKAREVGLRAGVALTYSSRAVISYKERVRLLESLIPKMKEAGVEKILIDTVVMDLVTLGLACRAIYEVKSRYGYPCGCGAHNAIAMWRSLKQRKDRVLMAACSAVANALPVAVGADFVLFGPISDAEFMVPAIAIVSASYGQVLMEDGRRPPPSHPRFKISRF